MPRPPSRKVYKSKSKTRKKIWCLQISKSLLGADEQEKTYFATEKEARYALKLSEAIARKSGIATVAMTDKDRRMALKAMGDLAAMGITLVDAVKEIKKRRAEEGASVPFAELVALYLSYLSGLPRKRSAKYLVDVGRIGKVWGDALGKKPVCRLTIREIDKVFAKLKLSASSKNAHIRVLRMVLNFGAAKDYLDDRIVKKFKVEEIELEVRILTPKQAEALIKASPPELVPYWVVCLFAGLRPQSEAFRLKWEDINFKTKKIAVRFGKRGGKRFVPMEDNLIAWLKPYSGLKGLVCPTVNWKRRFEETRASADKLLVKAKLQEEAILADDWAQDYTRHSAASYWGQKYQDVAKASMWLGHTVATHEAKYRVDIEDDKDAKRYFSIRPRKVKNVVPMIG